MRIALCIAGARPPFCLCVCVRVCVHIHTHMYTHMHTYMYNMHICTWYPAPIAVVAPAPRRPHPLPPAAHGPPLALPGKIGPHKGHLYVQCVCVCVCV